MMQELWWTYAFNIIVNSMLTFFTLACVVQLIILVFRIKQSRFKVLLFCVPLLKLAVDPFLYDFEHWALACQINPFEVEVGSRSLTLQLWYPHDISRFTDLIPFGNGIRMSLDNGQMAFTIADLLMLSLPPMLVKTLIVVIAVSTFLQMFIYLGRSAKDARHLSHILKNAVPCQLPIHNPMLRTKMEKIRLLESTLVGIPCAFGVFCKKICFPKGLFQQLSQEEFEAIIAHELGHLRWHDGVIRWLCELCRSLFWWIPTHWWMQRIESYQEAACDEGVGRFNVTGLDLASAIVKTAKISRHRPCPMLASRFVQGHPLTQRLQSLLNETGRSSPWRWLQLGFAAVITLSIICGRFWIF